VNEKERITFLSLLQQSVIVQAIITVMLVAVPCWLFASERAVPEGLQTMTMTVLAYWMGTKSQHAVEQTVRRSEARLESLYKEKDDESQQQPSASDAGHHCRENTTDYP